MELSKEKTIETLRSMRNEKLEELASLPRNQKRAKDLQRNIESLNHAIEAFSPKPARFSAHKQAIQAIEKFLEELGRAATRNEIATGVISGGWRGGNQAAGDAVYRSLTVFARGKGKSQNILRQEGDLVGLAKWGDDKFNANKGSLK